MGRGGRRHWACGMPDGVADGSDIDWAACATRRLATTLRYRPSWALFDMEPEGD